MPYVGVLYRRDDSDASPTEPVSPSSYWFPLFVIILACGGFLVWRRRNGDNAGPYGLRVMPNRPSGVRLSMDDDGPAATSFIMNNGSNESLPSHALSDLPVLPQSRGSDPLSGESSLPVHPALQSHSTSPIPSYTPPLAFPSTRFSRGGSKEGSLLKGQSGLPGSKSVASSLKGGRRSHRNRGPVERADEDSSNSEAEQDMFGIGSDEEEDSSRTISR